jgi:5-methylcytosine-specific restriction endonuclease McrA
MKKMTKYKCKICGEKICYATAKYGKGMCIFCSNSGENNPMWGKKQKKSTRDKMSKAQKGKPKSKDHCENLSKALKIAMNRPEVKEKMSIAQKGKKIKPETIEKISGKNSVWFGRHHTEATKEKMSKSAKGIPKSTQHKQNLSLAKGGTGIPYENYDLVYSIKNLPEYREWRTQVFKRDNFTCQECGQVGYQLEVHHIKRFSIIFQDFLNLYSKCNPIEDKQTLLSIASKYKSFWKLSNGKTLCQDCHKLTDNYKNKRGE